MKAKRTAAWVLGISAMTAGVAVLGAVPTHPKFGFPVYTNLPSGRQLTGQHVPATTPALSPEEARKKFTLPKGFEMRLFASEPEVVNPVAMTWDERGRLWVVELYEYPLGAKPGEPGRDRVKILEDVDGDGRVDSVKVFLDGMSLATGVLVGNGGVFVGQAPHLYWVEDTDGDDVADKKTIVQTGFGLEDRHELLNGFTWGPDGRMYMTHGVFTVTRAVNPDQPGEPVVLTAGVARYRPESRKMEIYAEGTSNPWGVDFDAQGNAFVSACVIDHLFHLAPGGLYSRQAGQPPHPYGYGLLPSIVDHRHHMAAYAGICVYQGDQYPAEYRGMALQGNIHDNSIHQDRLTPAGSTFKAGFVQDFVRANDGWFMPVSAQVGPDGAVWIMDWYDRYPCYQNANADPAGVDRERGRIWRAVYVGDQPGKPLAPRPAGLDYGKASTSELVSALKHPNVWQRRMAQRVLGGRKDVAASKAAMVSMVKSGPGEDARLAALWSLFSTGLIDDTILDAAAEADLASVRAWAARLTGEINQATSASVDRLKLLAGDDDVRVQVAVATALRQFTSGALTVNTPPRHPLDETAESLAGILEALMAKARDTDDRDLPFLLWMAVEPLAMYQPELAMGWFAEKGPQFMPLSGQLLNKVMRRFCDARDAGILEQAVRMVGMLPADSELLLPVLEGLIEGQRGKAQLPSKDSQALVSKLISHANTEVAGKARQLGSLWGDTAALSASLARFQDSSVSDAERIAAIKSARQSRSDDLRRALLKVVRSDGSDAVRLEAVRALGEAGVEETGQQLLGGWSTMTPAVQRSVAELCTTRWQWRWQLFSAVEKGGVKRGDLPPTVIRTLVTAKEQAERVKAQQLFGKVNATSTEKLKLIAEKRRVVIEGPVDLGAGKEQARKSCLICHKLHGEGAEVGPDLTGVGRSSLDALLHNVIHPNEIIGQGYENVIVETKDGRTLAGRVVENSASRVRLLMAGPVEEVISKGDVQGMTTSENSVMPEGLEQIPDADFRNLIWYILAPPQDGKPLNDQRRRELIGGAGDSAALDRGSDGESVALWAPEWRLDVPDFEGSPARLPEFGGRRNVLMTHPFSDAKPASLKRRVRLAPGKPQLRVSAAAHEKGDWELRVRIDGTVVHRETVTHDGERWRAVRVDLSRFAGREVDVQLENAANNWEWEFAYWADLSIEGSAVAAR